MTTQPIPWSAEREYKLRQRIISIWIGLWICFVGGLLVALFAATSSQQWAFLLAGVLWGVGIYLLSDLSQARNELGEEMCRLPGGQFYEGSGMLANKPRSTANLTRFIAWPRDSHSLLCACGRLLQWTNAHWIPNYDPEQFDGPAPLAVDPGAGRFVILCPCGLGHYKLKA